MKEKTGKSLVACLFCFVLFAGCTTGKVDAPKSAQPGSKPAQIQPAPTPFPAEEYMQEGFLDRNRFRVIIVISPEEAAEAAGSIESRARIRALATLRDYIFDRGWHYNERVHGDLMRLVMSSGRGSRIERHQGQDPVFVYEINRAGIQSEVDIIATRR